MEPAKNLLVTVTKLTHVLNLKSSALMDCVKTAEISAFNMKLTKSTVQTYFQLGHLIITVMNPLMGFQK